MITVIILAYKKSFVNAFTPLYEKNIKNFYSKLVVNR